MSRYLLDSNHASRLVTLNHPLREQFLLQRHRQDSFFLCPPVALEVLFGLRELAQAKRNLVEWERLVLLFETLTLDVEDASFAASLRWILRRQGKALATMDSLIASLALRHDLIVLSTDADFDAIPEIIRENWVAPTGFTG